MADGDTSEQQATTEGSSPVGEQSTVSQPGDTSPHPTVLPTTPYSPNQSGELAAVVFQKTEFSGPLPPPAILREYESILPGSASRIFGVFEQQASHRIAIEGQVVASSTKRSREGLYAGFGIALSAVVASCYFAYTGHAVEGASLFGVTALGMVSVFVTGKNEQQRELREKAKAVPEIERVPDAAEGRAVPDPTPPEAVRPANPAP